MSSFLIAIVGRPNVGKSRLFNRLSGTTQAIVHDYEGVTRDRQYGRGEWYTREFTVIDTGGFLPQTEEPMLVSMRRQAQLAIEEADAIIFLMDGRAGLLPADVRDRRDAALLGQAGLPTRRTRSTPSRSSRVFLADFFRLGVDVYPLSAEHGFGLDRLMDDVAELIAPPLTEEELPEFPRVAVVGKPNAGKSSIINKLLGEDRLLTSDIAGTTRDSVDTIVEREGKQYMVIDTAGLRRKRSISEQLEHFAVVQAIRSIDRADVALLVIGRPGGRDRAGQKRSRA